MVSRWIFDNKNTKIIRITHGGRCRNLKNGMEASEVTEEIPAGCAGEGKQSKGSLTDSSQEVGGVLEASSLTDSGQDVGGVVEGPGEVPLSPRLVRDAPQHRHF